ncbi:MAG: YbjN domain-containing protein [Chloroflexi bacterium]|jgi:hypothetical protein|nr:YbjN domain-containing protein [Anaerolineaceae bacterium]NMB90966.1 YbjN domain-containing protein [Chloroflexota bacterium]
MGTLFDLMHKFFIDDEWYFMQLDNRPILQMGFQGKNGKWTCYSQVNEDQDLFFFYSVCPVNVPEEKRSAVAEYITRANYGLKIGNFEMDYQDGEVRYKTSIDVENDRLNQALISNLVYANLWTMDRYLPGILSVIYGDAQPESAIIRVEHEV